MTNILHFKEISKTSIPLAGGKGAQLGELYNLGLPVPEGFVVTALAYQHFLEANRLSSGIGERLAALDVENTQALETTAQEIQRIILNAPMPRRVAEEIAKNYKKLTGYVAVRSSATAEDLPEASFAGQQSTFLNISGAENVVEAVKKCFASLFTARAIYYRAMNKFDHMKVLIAVVVQRMVEAEKAGVMFTINPVTNNRDEMIIEAGFGLGEAVVAGEITPDSYVIDKKTDTITDKNVSPQSWGYFREDGVTVKKDIDFGHLQTLSDAEIKGLAHYGKKIEQHYNWPQDIEWAIDKKGIKILQARPVTTLPSTVQAKSEAQRTNHAIDAKILLDKQWTPFFTRPFSLFGTSLWHSWFVSQELRDIFSLQEPDALFAEEPRGIVHHYRIDAQVEQYWQAGNKLVLEKPEYCKKLLQKGISLNHKTESLLQKKQPFTRIRPAVEFLQTLFITAAVMPYIVLKALEQKGIQNKELRSLAEELRAVSYYPVIIEKMIMPLVHKELEKMGVSNVKEAAEVITLPKLLSKQIFAVTMDIEQRKEGKHFVYSVINGKESLVWMENVGDIISTLEKTDHSLREICGQTAFPGIARGTARIILSSQAKGAFNPGDILVTINSNPDLLVFIKKAAAIVTDEGGITCHAAIVSREMKKPCVIGTKIVTRVLKDGDFIEVNGDTGMVRIVEQVDNKKEKVEVRFTDTPAQDQVLRPLEKFLTRDAPLIAIEHWWYKGCTEAFPAFFGFSFPKMVIVKTKYGFTSYWDIASVNGYIQGFHKWFINNANRIDFIHKRLIDGLKFFRNVKKLKKHSSIKEVTKTLRIIIHHFLHGLPAVDAVHILPDIHKKLQIGGRSPLDNAQIQKLISWREKEGNFFFSEGIDAFYFLLGQIEKKKRWDKNTLKYITYEELTKALLAPTTFPREELDKRSDLDFAFIDGKIIFGQDIEKKLRQIGYVLKKEDISMSKEIEGACAMPGKVQGVCRCIFNRNEINRIREGEILVAPMTSPWYVPAIKRAAAIITDEGGTTSHAAIICRELKKPCVIGTKIATKVLKDGDLVEVDADKGIIRLLAK